MSLPIKAGIATITIGTLGGVGYLGSTYLSKSKEEQTTEISQLIKDSKEYVLLNTATTGNSDEKYWPANWESYKQDSLKLATDIFGLTGWKKDNPTDLTSLLKKRCEAESKKSVLNNTDPIYENVTKYCTRGVTIEEDMQNKGITDFLDTKASGKDAKIWAKRHKEKTTLETTLGKLGVTEKGEAITEEKIRNACANSKTKHKKEAEYQATFEAFNKVCIKQPEDDKIN